MVALSIAVVLLSLVAGWAQGCAHTMDRLRDAATYAGIRGYADAHGNYRFDAERLNDAHEDCVARTAALMAGGHSVVVANTFTRLANMRPYEELAARYGHRLYVVEARTAGVDVHGVPDDAKARMCRHWEALGGRKGYATGDPSAPTFVFPALDTEAPCQTTA